MSHKASVVIANKYRAIRRNNLKVTYLKSMRLGLQNDVIYIGVRPTVRDKINQVQAHNLSL